jgi:hypothetical protein
MLAGIVTYYSLKQVIPSRVPANLRKNKEDSFSLPPLCRRAADMQVILVRFGTGLKRMSSQLRSVDMQACFC